MYVLQITIKVVPEFSPNMMFIPKVGGDLGTSDREGIPTSTSAADKDALLVISMKLQCCHEIFDGSHNERTDFMYGISRMLIEQVGSRKSMVNWFYDITLWRVPHACTDQIWGYDITADALAQPSPH